MLATLSLEVMVDNGSSSSLLHCFSSTHSIVCLLLIPHHGFGPCPVCSHMNLGSNFLPHWWNSFSFFLRSLSLRLLPTTTSASATAPRHFSLRLLNRRLMSSAEPNLLSAVIRHWCLRQHIPIATFFFLLLSFSATLVSDISWTLLALFSTKPQDHSAQPKYRESVLQASAGAWMKREPHSSPFHQRHRVQEAGKSPQAV